MTRSLKTVLWAVLLPLTLASHHHHTAHRVHQAVEGKPLTIHCFAVERALKDLEYDDVEKMEWRKDGYVVAYYSKSRSSTESWVSDPRYSLDRARFSLTIDKLYVDDSGQYKCWPRFHVLPKWMKESRWHPDVISLSVHGLPSKPGRPAVLSYASRNVLISWTASISHVQAPILRYTIRILIGKDNDTLATKEFTIHGNGTSWLVTGLQPLTVYRFEVAGENSAGRGHYSASSYPIRTKGEAPSAPPKILSIYNSTNTSVIVRWDHPPASALQGGQLAGYRLIARTIDDAVPKRDLHLLKPDITTFEMLNLAPHTKYLISLEADNIFGFSPPATSVILTAEGALPIGPTITGLRVLSNSAVSLSFAQPSTIRGILTHYTLYFQPSDSLNESDQLHSTTAIKVDALSLPNSGILNYRLENLEPCKKYLLWITASTSRGESPTSDKWHFITDSVAPSQPIFVNVSLVGVNSVFIEWLPPTRFCIQVDFYLVNLVDERFNRKQFNTSDSQLCRIRRRNAIDQIFQGVTDGIRVLCLALLSNLEYFVSYAITVRAATRSILITERQRYYVGPESVSVRLKLLATSDVSEGETIVNLRTWICPFRDFGPVRQLALRHFRPQTGDLQNALRCDEGLIVPGDIMSRNNVTAAGGANLEENLDTHSSVEGKGGSGVSVVAVAVLGTFGLLIILILLVMLLLHFWRRYFGGKNCLAYATDAIDSSVRNVHNDMESAGKTRKATSLMYLFSNDEALDEADCDSIQMEDFVDYVKAMHVDSDSGFARLYERIEHQCATLDQFQKLPYDHSVLSDNKLKNRYVNILAYDHSRVKLRSLRGVRHSDYINANFVDGFRQRRAYIATQGPLPNTIADFWRMVWEHKCNVVVMITNIVERGRKKCEQYWPSEGEETYGSLAVSLLNEHVTAFYTVRTMKLRCVKKKAVNAEPKRIVVQYHCTCWADHGVPESASAILKFIEKSTAANHDPTAPIIVHCSAGVGRSGTYIVIDSMLRQMQATGRLNICGFLKRIRHQRMHLVQTEEQYVFCYDALVEAITVGNTEIDARDFRRTIMDWHPIPDCTNSILARQFEHIMAIKTPSCIEASKPYNDRKNRQGAPVPTDVHRVIISAVPGETGSDYINASFLPGYHRANEFVVTQYPITETINNFWQMIWDHSCRLVVLLQAPSEDCKEFWPVSDAVTDSLRCGSFVVSLLAKSDSERSICVEVLLRSTQEEYQLLCQVIVFADWRTRMQDSNEVWQSIQNIQAKRTSHSGPLTVIDAYGGHEAAGFCLLSALSCQLDQEACVDVYTLTRCYHERRPGVFSEFNQYRHFYECLETLVSKNYPNDSIGLPKSHSCMAALRSRSLPSSLRLKSTSSLSLQAPLCNGFGHNSPKDTTL